MGDKTGTDVARIGSTGQSVEVLDEEEQSHGENPEDLELSFVLPNDIHLKAYIFLGEVEARMIYLYHHVRLDGNDESAEVEFCNDIRLVVDYQNGKAHKCELSMEMVNVKNLGQEYFAGLDVSPGAKLYVKFRYVRRMLDGVDCFQMTKIQIGARTVFNLDDISGNLPTTPLNFPFPLKDRITMAYDMTHGPFQVPFVNNERKEINFEFKGDIRKIRKIL